MSVINRIRQAALALPHPFPYLQETQHGSLGCANVVSYALKQAGVLDHLELSVAGLSTRLKALGWTAVLQPYRTGDVANWGPWPGGEHGHTGIILVEGDTVWTIQNSSSQHRVVKVLLATYGRPLIEVLRAPAEASPAVATSPLDIPDRLGSILAMVRQSARLTPPLAGLEFLCRLPGAVYIESDLDLDTDGEEEPGIKYEHGHQKGLSIGGGVNSNRVPYVVLPINFAKDYGLRLGDVAAVLYRDMIEFAVYADNGPRQKIGEGSIALHRSLGFERVRDGRIIDVGISKGVVTILFAGSGNGTAQTPEKIRAIGRKYFAALGGKP